MPSSWKVLIIGGGGREHAMVWKCAQSPLAGRIYCAPGNAGISSLATCVPIGADDIDGLVSFARQESIDLVLCGPEQPLVAGITDRLLSEGIATFGPTGSGARLEGSKSWARDVMRKAGLPIPRYVVLDDVAEAEAYLRNTGGPIVVKADGLAAGKGVAVCDDTDQALFAVREMMSDRIYGESGSRIVLEERLVGEEFSAMAFLQGDVIHPMVVSQDHKRIHDGDLGPNTGGMGAYTPVPFVTPDLEREVVDRILRPLVETLREEGINYQGVIYPGLMMTAEGVRIIEFNCRFGDPEAEVILPRMDFDLLEVMAAGARHELTDSTSLAWKPDACACVMMASGGYPGAYEAGKPIHGLDAVSQRPDTVVFHSGTSRNAAGEVVTAGGRVLGVTAWGDDGKTALRRAYEAVGEIRWEGVTYRRDIGHRLLSSI